MNSTEVRTRPRPARLATTALLAVVATAMNIVVFVDQARAQEEVFIEPGERAEQLESPEGYGADRPMQFAVSFDYLEVARLGGDVVVGYQIRRADWAQLALADISLWIAMYVPNDAAPGTFAYSYHLPLEERAGVVEFPEWLSTLQADEIGLCVLGTMPFDNLGLARGYVCESLLLTPIERRIQKPDERQLHETSATVTFDLIYYGGMPYYGYFPWRGPFL